MKRTSIILSCLVTLFLGLAPEAAPQGETPQAPEVKQTRLTWKQATTGDGPELYAELCAVCHGVDATGNGPAAPALAMPAPDLTRLALNNGGEFPADAVRRSITGEAEVVAHGTLEMPVWGKVFVDVRPDVKLFRREAFARARIEDLTSYLDSIQVR